MNFKKKRSFREIARAALTGLVFFAVPIWGLMYVMITESVIAGLALIAWLCLSYIIVGRIKDV